MILDSGLLFWATLYVMLNILFYLSCVKYSMLRTMLLLLFVRYLYLIFKTYMTKQWWRNCPCNKDGLWRVREFRL